MRKVKEWSLNKKITYKVYRKVNCYTFMLLYAKWVELCTVLHHIRNESVSPINLINYTHCQLMLN